MTPPGVSDADGTLKWVITIPGAGFHYDPLEEEAVSLRASRYIEAVPKKKTAES